MVEVTLLQVLERAARSEFGVRFLDREEKEGFFTYRDLKARAEGVAGGLEAMGLRPGDRVALILETSPSFYDAFFGTLLAGGVPVPLYPPVRLGRLDEYHERTAAMLRAARCRVVLTESAIRRVLGRTMATVEADLGCVTMQDLPRRDARRVDVRPDDLAFIQFSSGTTLAPKPVRLTHRQILANVEVILDAIRRLSPEENVVHSGVSWLPLYHDMGLVGFVFGALALPADLTLLSPALFVARPATWLRAISRYRATVSGAPHFAYNLSAERIRDAELEGVDLSSWRLALDGAEPVTPSVLRRFIERFRPYGFREEALTPVYGLAEATLAVTFSDPLRPFESETFDRAELTRHVAHPAREGTALVSVGKPLPGYELKIVGEEGSEAPPGQVGRVWVRGPSLMDGYDGLPETTAEVMHEGWLDTGDTGFFHVGNLYLYGREKDLIILRGRNYAPQDVEQALEGVPGVRAGCTAAVGVVPEGGASEVLVVLVERRPGRRPTEAELTRALRERILDRTGLVPEKVVLLRPGTLPRTSSGKIRRNETRRLYLKDALTPPRPVNAVRMAGEMIRSEVAFLRSRARRKPGAEGEIS